MPNTIPCPYCRNFIYFDQVQVKNGKEIRDLLTRLIFFS